MAPKESETQSAVLDYLSQQNRPYSTNDLHLNLHKEHGKTAIQKVIDLLVAENKLKVKVNGKQNCYFANQDLLPTSSEEELAGLEAGCQAREEEVRVLREKVKAAQGKVLQLCTSLTLGEAREQLEEVVRENQGLEERLGRLEGNTEVVSAEDRAAISAAHARTVTLWRKRKRMASEVLDSILESWQKPKKSLFEDIGIDTDESVGVKMPK